MKRSVTKSWLVTFVLYVLAVLLPCSLLSQDSTENDCCQEFVTCCCEQAVVDGAAPTSEQLQVGGDVAFTPSRYAIGAPPECQISNVDGPCLRCGPSLYSFHCAFLL